MGDLHFCILPKKVARDRGFKHYFTGKPCKWGHFSHRLASDGACVACNRDRYLDTREQYLEQRRRAYAEKRANIVRDNSKGIKHADLVGTSITTKSGTKLNIVGHNGASGNGSRHLFHCDECAKDTELFGGGQFWARYSDVKHGCTPCGCSIQPRRGEWGYYVLCKRAATSKGLLFYGWRGKYKGWKTSLSIYCPDHGLLERSKINNLLNHGQGCRRCYEESVRERAPSNEAVGKKYLDRCGYPDGTTLSRIGAEGEFGTRSKFEVWCPVCANDEYAKAGACNGVFETSIESLCSGHCSCRCGGWTKRKTLKIVEYQIYSICKEYGAEFLGWPGGYRNSRSKALMRCGDHGEYTQSVQCILKGRGCPSCAKTGYSTAKTGYLYLLQSDGGEFLKIGITNKPDNRFKHLTSTTPFGFSVLECREMGGDQAPIKEGRLLGKYQSANLKGFHGATEWLVFDHRILEEFR